MPQGPQTSAFGVPISVKSASKKRQRKAYFWRAEDIALVVRSPISKKALKKNELSTGDDHLIMKPGTERIAQYISGLYIHYGITIWNSHRLRNAALRNSSRQRTFCSRSVTVRTLFARQFSSKSYNFVMSKMPPVVHRGKQIQDSAQMKKYSNDLQWLSLPSQ